MLSATLGELWPHRTPRAATQNLAKNQLSPQLHLRSTSYACRPAAFCRRLLCVSRAPWACFSQLSINFPEDSARCREPASSVNERSLPARPATGGTESTRATGKVAAELRAMTRTNMPAELLRPVTSNHPFLTHAARTRRCGVLLWERAVERSEERLNMSI